MTQKILLSSSEDVFYALVDDRDYYIVRGSVWYAEIHNHTVYAIRTRPSTYMHRLLMNAKPDELVDHIDGNGLNNRRKANLRIVDSYQNSRNSSSHSDSSSQYKGVSWATREQRWHTQIYCKGKAYGLGYYRSEIDAAIAYDKKALELFGEFAKLNFP